VNDCKPLPAAVRSDDTTHNSAAAAAATTNSASSDRCASVLKTLVTSPSVILLVNDVIAREEKFCLVLNISFASTCVGLAVLAFSSVQWRKLSLKGRSCKQYMTI
jgi:hypothetical protein